MRVLILADSATLLQESEAAEKKVNLMAKIKREDGAWAPGGKQCGGEGAGRPDRSVRCSVRRTPCMLTPLRYNPPGTSFASFDNAGNTLFFLSPPSLPLRDAVTLPNAARNRQVRRLPVGKSLPVKPSISDGAPKRGRAPFPPGRP